MDSSKWKQLFPFPLLISKIPSSTIQHCCPWDEKHAWNFSVVNPVNYFAKWKQLFPFPHLYQKFQVQQSTLVFMRWKTHENFSVENLVDSSNWKQLFLLSKIPSSTIRHWCSWDERHNRKTSVWILLNGNNYSHSPTLILLSLLYILYTVHFSNRNTTRNEHTAIIS